MAVQVTALNPDGSTNPVTTYTYPNGVAYYVDDANQTVHIYSDAAMTNEIATVGGFQAVSLS